MKSNYKKLVDRLVAANAAAIVFMVFGAVVCLQAQSFGAPVEYSVSSNPYGVAVGDFNGDGQPDLAVANNASKTVSVLLGNGGSSFNSKTDYAVGASPYSIVAVDLNKDGKLDLVTANSFSLTSNLSVLLGNGDGTFASKVDYVSTGLRPESLVAADLNGDGNPDLVVNSDNGAIVFMGNGDGTLKPGVTYAADSTSYSLAVADFNQDNKPDLAVSSYGNTSGRVSVLLGKGDGTFLPAVHYTAGPSPFSIAAGDFNGDGKTDLVTANIQIGNVGILLGQGDGTFQAPVSYATPTFFSPYEITTADLNNDGKLDVLVAGNGFGLCALKGNGDGTFRPPVFFTTGGVFATVADLNADGKPDVISGLQANTIGVFINQTGPFSISGSIKDSNGAAMNAVTVGLNGGAQVQTTTDSSGGYSFADLATGGNYALKPSRQNYVFAPLSQSFSNISSNLVADFTGTLQSYSITGTVRDSFSNPMANVTVALTGDQTGSVTTLADGSYSFSNLPGGGNYTITPSYPKFVFFQPSRTLTNLSSNQVVNFSGSLPTFSISGAINDANNGSSISTLPVLLTGTRNASTLTSSQGYSFSNLPVDGNYTISAFNASGNTLFTNFLMLPPATQTVNGLSANTTLNFSAKRLNPSLNGLSPVGIAQGDLNGDGKPDLVATTSTGGSIHVLIGNGDGTFKPDVSYAAPANALDVAVGDFDRDGKLDVASCSAGVGVFLGNGDGTLKTRVDYPVTGTANVIRTADVNLDGKLDLLVLSSGNNLSILLGNGDGTFAAAKTKSYPNAIGSIVIGDFNSDNKPDLVTTSFPGSVFLFTGNGDGTFADPVSFPAGNDVRQASVADLNGDGKLDLVVGNFRGFTVLLGNGNGTFQAPVTTSLTFELLGSVLRDFDGDGKMDLAIVSAGGGVMFLSGNGDGTFNSPTFYGPGSYSVALVTADFNGDGKPDLAFTNNGGPDVTVLLNASLTRLPSVQFSAASVTVNEGAGNALVTVTRTTGLAGAAKVDFATSDQAGTQSCATVNQKASSRCDYTAMSGTLDFAPGDLSKTISIPLVDDAFVEGNESFTVSLTGASGAILGAPSQITVNIVDNDNTVGPNPSDQPPFFVAQHYRDFLSRQPDSDGLAFWTGELTSCGADAACIEVKRINVSAAFFLSIEFQQTGYLVERFYKTAFGDATGTSTLGSTHQLAVPRVRFSEFLQDTQRIGRGVVVLAPGWEQVLENNKQAYAAEFVATTRFLTVLPTTMTPAQFVDKLNQNAGNVLSASERTTAINLFAGAADSSNMMARAQALRQLAEDQDLYNSEFNRAFVLTQYFGYLRRNPNDAPDADYTGYEFWLNKLNQFNGDYIAAEMVKAFISSSEYRQRFGP